METNQLIASFLEITAGDSHETAVRFLQNANWRLEAAIQHFFNAASAGAGSSNNHDTIVVPQSTTGQGSSGQHAAPRPEDWEPETGLEEEQQQRRRRRRQRTDNLSRMFQPPTHIMYQGTFEQAKFTAAVEDKWLIVNLQSYDEFSSHTLNRDTWANQTVVETMRTNFLFWQRVYNDDEREGSKVRTYYRVESFPIVLVIDPITGRRMHSWTGMIGPERLVEVLLQFMDESPKNRLENLCKSRRAAAAKEKEEESPSPTSKAADPTPMAVDENQGTKQQELPGDEERRAFPEKVAYPPLPEEATGDRSRLCRVGIKLPDGRNVQRSFLRGDRVQLLWSLCCLHLEEAQRRPFRFVLAAPGASKSLEYGTSNLMTFEESGLANYRLSMVWEQ